MRDIKGLAKNHIAKPVGAYLNKNLGLLIRNPKDILPHHVRHTQAKFLKIYLNNHLTYDTDKEKYIPVVFA